MRAAQYVRMSTEHQQYSIANQEAVIAEYARVHGFEVVRTYADAGISGLDLAHRPGLRQLLDDVIGHRADFTGVLVYDVSRWGRFQDADESAHYEFLCKQSGVRVHYCAEPFSNDDNVVSSLLKAIKRTMAGEYSRELSAKVFTGQCRLTQLGFKMGGQAGYALRRVLVDSNKAPLGELLRREWKYLSTQRVILAPGPEREIEVVRSIFSMYLDEGINTREIADRLNQQGILRHTGATWRKDHIRKILFDPKYAGCAVFGRCTKKFRSKQKTNPRNLWIVQPNSFVPVISFERFQAAEEKRRSRTRFLTDEQLLQRLREYVERHGSISHRVMRPGNGLPSAPAYLRRFGSLWRAYELAGISPWKHETAKARSLRAAITEQFQQAMIASGTPFERKGRIYTIPCCKPFVFEVAKYLEPLLSGEMHWEVYVRKEMPCGPCAAARLGPDNRSVQDWCVFDIFSHGQQRLSLRDSAVGVNGSVRDTPRELISLLLECLRMAH